jgi:hypothetical protein
MDASFGRAYSNGHLISDFLAGRPEKPNIDVSRTQASRLRDAIRNAATSLAPTATPDVAQYFASLDRKRIAMELDSDREHYLEGFRRAGWD